MNESELYQNITIPNIHIAENEKVLSFLRNTHPYDKVILPFAGNKVNQVITSSDLVGHFAFMTSLPGNSKYVIYGSEALVHPETGIIFGIITGVNIIYRLPDNLLNQVMDGHIVNFRVMKDSGIDDMRDLESNWVSSQSITEALVYKCFNYYGETPLEQLETHLNLDLDLTTPRTREFEEQERSRRLLAIGIIVAACILSVIIWYAAASLMKFP